jgi:hypothetical protein
VPRPARTKNIIAITFDQAPMSVATRPTARPSMWSAMSSAMTATVSPSGGNASFGQCIVTTIGRATEFFTLLQAITVPVQALASPSVPVLAGDRWEFLSPASHEGQHPTDTMRFRIQVLTPRRHHLNHSTRHGKWRSSQVVRQWFAKPSFEGSIPSSASI